MKQMLLILFCCIHIITSAQTDSATAFYLKSVVDRIEKRLDVALKMSYDTTIADDKGSVTVHTDYYIEQTSGEIEKIFEKTLFGQVSTEITVYYRSASPILFQTKQWQGSTMTVDFDYYFQNDNPVYVMKREFAKGNPDGDQVLHWCHQMWKESQTNKLVKNEEDVEPLEKPPGWDKKTIAPPKKSIFSIFKKKKH